jgi:hypothetical protein
MSAFPQQTPFGNGMVRESFQVRRCQVNQRLEESSLFSLSSHRMPESFKDLMAFPPVREII